ncbi:MAG: LCP family protein [Armatimonadetes bacterium]|nr:LCP family protein [Armatimonadota bacterium]
MNYSSRAPTGGDGPARHDRFPRSASAAEWEDTIEIRPIAEGGSPGSLHGDSSRRRARGLSLFDRLLWTVCLGIITGVLAANWKLLTGGVKFFGLEWNPLKIVGVAPFEGKQNVSILVMGTDDKIEQGRSDTMMVAQINVPDKKVALVSIPRDSRVNIPGYGVDRINAAYPHGGAPLARSAAEALLGRRLDYYIKTDFNGFQDIVDALGGIELDVEKRMVYRDRAQNLRINLRPGHRKLMGYDAMGYVRFRHDALGDIGRIQRQQKFVHAVLDRMMQPTMLPRLPFILKAIQRNVKTDIPAQDFLALARIAHGFSGGNMKTAMIPGEPVRIGGKSYWEVNRYETAELLASLDRQALANKPDPAKSSPSISVCVLNGCGVPGAANQVARQLKEEGIEVTETGNAESFGYRDSQIIDHTGKGDKGERVRSVIGFGAVLPRKGVNAAEADVTLILGKDFKRV